MKTFERFEAVFAFAVARAKLAKTLPTSHSDVDPPVPDSKSVPIHFTIENLVPWLSFAFGIILSTVFILFEAETFQDYTECLYPLVTTMVNFGHFTALAWNGAHIFQLIDSFESMIESRKLAFNSPSINDAHGFGALMAGENPEKLIKSSLVHE